MTEAQLQHKREYNRERYRAIKADPKRDRLYKLERRIYVRLRYRNDPEYRARENARCREYKRKRKQSNASNMLQPQEDL